MTGQNGWLVVDPVVHTAPNIYPPFAEVVREYLDANHSGAATIIHAHSKQVIELARLMRRQEQELIRQTGETK